MSDQPRPVWLYHGDVSWLYTTEDTPQRREALARLTDGFNRAPADATETVLDAADLYFQEHGDQGNEADATRALLRALGYPA